MTPPLSRRDVLRGTAAGLTTVLAGNAAKAAPNDRVNVAVIGVRGRGRSLAEGFAGMSTAQVACLCDVDGRVFDKLLPAVTAKQGNKAPRIESDLRRVLDDKSIDAIAVATPDHWHALATIWGCQAGKHVYVEKPASQSLWEGRKMVEAARKYNRVVQLGTQSRSAASYLDLMAFLKSGGLGKVHIAKAWNSQIRPDLRQEPDGTAPKEVDYNLWQGPAPERPFNPNRFHSAWHWLWDYGTGDIGNDGVHDLDIARWGLGVKSPKTVTCAAARYVNKHWDVADSMYVTYSFPETDQLLVYEQRDWTPYLQEGFENGVAFYGSEGYVLAGRAGWKLIRKGNKPEPTPQHAFSDEPHRADFLACIKSGDRPHADIEEGHLSSTLAHLGNVAFRAGRCLNFDGAGETILGDSEANALLRRAYRKPFEVPEKV